MDERRHRCQRRHRPLRQTNQLQRQLASGMRLQFRTEKRCDAIETTWRHQSTFPWPSSVNLCKEGGGRRRREEAGGGWGRLGEAMGGRGRRPAPEEADQVEDDFQLRW